MAEHGGYRKPANPAPASGPGSQSRRTDGNQPRMDLPGAKYGEQAAYQDAQSSAPMAQQNSGRGGGVAAPPPPAPTPLGAPTERPGEPVTAGADAGAGPDAAAAGIDMDLGQQDANQMRRLVYGLEYIANMPGSNPYTRSFVRMLKSRL